MKNVSTVDNIKEAMAKCKWKYIPELYEYQEYWETECGQAHQFMDGTPRENGYIYCPYCGNKIEVTE